MAMILFLKATLRGRPGLVPRQIIDRRGRRTTRWVREHQAVPAHLPGSMQENIQRGQAAMAHVLATHEDAELAMFRPGLGWIDFIWGTEGKPPTPSGRRKGARGVAHILEARQRKDGLTEDQAQRLALFLPEVIARGTRVRAVGAHAVNERIAFAGYEAVLAPAVGGQGARWLLTGWRVAPDGRA